MKDTSINQFENKKWNNFFAARRNITAQRKKDESCKSKTGQKLAN